MDIHPLTGLGTPDLPIGTLGSASLPRTPAAGEGVETPPLHGAPTHVPGPTPELCASLPSGSLATWSAEEVSRCLRVLGRDFTRDECDATDVSIFDTAAVTCQLDGNQLAAVTGDALRAMGFVRYEHRAAIMDWIRHRLEVRPGVFFPPPLAVRNERRVSALTTTQCWQELAKPSATARARHSSHFPSRVAADAPRVAADAPRVGQPCEGHRHVAAARSAPETRRGRAPRVRGRAPFGRLTTLALERVHLSTGRSAQPRGGLGRGRVLPRNTRG